MNFLNETKKWLKQNANRDTSTFLFLDTRNNADGTRCTRITVMPKLIREYESEYHFLFWLILKCVKSEEALPEYLYLLPNALRKTLDTFLAFKIPGSSGLTDKLSRPIVKNSGIDLARLHALDRLAQLESHADNIDDLVSFSSLQWKRRKMLRDHCWS